ncbi:hypothetical protein B0T17DRAFT_513644 [Bombardia bombarda]|uniref:Uncharacterized protein n=1 Tax=Bombardia bombarda TaxID=252184 RepID=A0AA39XJR6_9PEZI|nr:hypothetical protein B0T17DRAFT_513644 [Bombardia bombarda]
MSAARGSSSSFLGAEAAMVEEAVVSLNPAQPIHPGPLIADMLCTCFCIPGSIFLVESIERCVPVGGKKKDYRAVRVLLGDGELCVQALLRPEMHCFVDGGQIYEGCYVRVDAFELRRVEAEQRKDVEDDGVGNPAAADGQKKKAKGESSKGKTVYLLVGDMTTVGWNNAYLEILRAETQAEGGEVAVGAPTRVDVAAAVAIPPVAQRLLENNMKSINFRAGGRPEGSRHSPMDGAPEQPRISRDDKMELDTESKDKKQDPQPPHPRAATKKEPEHISDSDEDVFETLQVSAERATQRRHHLSQAPLPPPPPVDTTDFRQELQTTVVQHNTRQQQKPLP